MGCRRLRISEAAAKRAGKRNTRAAGRVLKDTACSAPLLGVGYPEMVNARSSPQSQFHKLEIPFYCATIP